MTAHAMPGMKPAFDLPLADQLSDRDHTNVAETPRMQRNALGQIIIDHSESEPPEALGIADILGNTTPTSEASPSPRPPAASPTPSPGRRSSSPSILATRPETEPAPIKSSLRKTSITEPVGDANGTQNTSQRVRSSKDPTRAPRPHTSRHACRPPTSTHSLTPRGAHVPHPTPASLNPKDRSQGSMVDRGRQSHYRCRRSRGRSRGPRDR